MGSVTTMGYERDAQNPPAEPFTAPLNCTYVPRGPEGQFHLRSVDLRVGCVDVYELAALGDRCTCKSGPDVTPCVLPVPRTGSPSPRRLVIATSETDVTQVLLAVY